MTLPPLNSKPQNRSKSAKAGDASPASLSGVPKKLMHVHPLSFLKEGQLEAEAKAVLEAHKKTFKRPLGRAPVNRQNLNHQEPVNHREPHRQNESQDAAADDVVLLARSDVQSSGTKGSGAQRTGQSFGQDEQSILAAEAFGAEALPWLLKREQLTRHIVGGVARGSQETRQETRQETNQEIGFRATGFGTGTAWVSVENPFLAEAMLRQLGPARAKQLWRSVPILAPQPLAWALFSQEILAKSILAKLAWHPADADVYPSLLGFSKTWLSQAHSLLSLIFGEDPEDRSGDRPVLGGGEISDRSFMAKSFMTDAGPDRFLARLDLAFIRERWLQERFVKQQAGSVVEPVMLSNLHTWLRPLQCLLKQDGLFTQDDLLKQDGLLHQEPGREPDFGETDIEKALSATAGAAVADWILTLPDPYGPQLRQAGLDPLHRHWSLDRRLAHLEQAVEALVLANPVSLQNRFEECFEAIRSANEPDVLRPDCLRNRLLARAWRRPFWPTALACKSILRDLLPGILQHDLALTDLRARLAAGDPPDLMAQIAELDVPLPAFDLSALHQAPYFWPEALTAFIAETALDPDLASAKRAIANHAHELELSLAKLEAAFEPLALAGFNLCLQMTLYSDQPKPGKSHEQNTETDAKAETEQLLSVFSDLAAWDQWANLEQQAQDQNGQDQNGQEQNGFAHSENGQSIPVPIDWLWPGFYDLRLSLLKADPAALLALARCLAASSKPSASSKPLGGAPASGPEPAKELLQTPVRILALGQDQKESADLELIFEDLMPSRESHFRESGAKSDKTLLTLRTPALLLTLPLADLEAELAKRSLASEASFPDTVNPAGAASFATMESPSDIDIQADLAAAHDLDDEVLDDEVLDDETIDPEVPDAETLDGDGNLEGSDGTKSDLGKRAEFGAEADEEQPAEISDQDQEQDRDQEGQDQENDPPQDNEKDNDGQNDDDLEPIDLMPPRPEPRPDPILLNVVENVLAHLLWRGLSRARQRALGRLDVGQI